jgi:hypothetical protein
MKKNSWMQIEYVMSIKERIFCKKECLVWRSVPSCVRPFFRLSFRDIHVVSEINRESGFDNIQ